MTYFFDYGLEGLDIDTGILRSLLFLFLESRADFVSSFFLGLLLLPFIMTRSSKKNFKKALSLVDRYYASTDLFSLSKERGKKRARRSIFDSSIGKSSTMTN